MTLFSSMSFILPIGLESIFACSSALFSIALKFVTSLFTVEGLTGHPLRLEIPSLLKRYNLVVQLRLYMHRL